MTMPDTLFNRFKVKFEALQGHVHLVASWEEAAEEAGAICQGAEAGRVALARAPGPFQEALEGWCKRNQTDLLRPPYAADTLPGAIDAAQVGITCMDFAIARTGTLVEVSLDDATRLVSSLPRTHIGLVSARELVDDLDAAAPRLREIFAEHPQNCVVSFLSGPSRTGDIEMRLTLGVHGPAAAHAIVLSEAMDVEMPHG
ncbi:MAG: lactate utilization protein [Candidatus Hydrogenedentes bacterium]|nr:lactate utilization protein [Candidatus Hydrogenedentota bacterium]